MWVKLNDEHYLNLALAREVTVSFSDPVERGGGRVRGASLFVTGQDGKTHILYDLAYSHDIEADVAVKLKKLERVLDGTEQLLDLSK